MVTYAPVRFALAAVFSLSLAITTMAEPIGLMERYALADDREAMLAQLIPGSEDFYFYHCLHYQTSGQLERAETILRDWLAEHQGSEIPVISAMLDRQRLLTYGDSPQRTIDHLIRRLGVQLQHAPPAIKGERRFPSQLDVAALETDRIVIEALQRNDPLKPLGIQHLAERFRNGQTAGLSINLKEFLARVDGPYVQQLDELVIKELSSRRDNEKRFGDLQAHMLLTLDELQNVAAKVKEIADDNDYVSAILRRLRPNADTDPSQQPDVRLDYLNRVEAYVRDLPPSYNSLKASATYRLLEAKLARGDYDRELFMRYLQLPRVSPIVHAEWLRRPNVKAQLNDDFMELALLPPIGDEQPLVRAYLEHFLKDAEDSDAFSEYLQPEYLRRVFAETKLLYGVGPEERWYKLLSAPQRQAIRDSTELRLAPQNPTRFSSDDPTELIVDLKNIDEIVVRIYEINTHSYYRTHDRAVDTDIDLDGLVATYEKKLTYNQPAVQRHRETLSLDEIEGRGVWVVDLVGKGVRARALIRRGAIHHVDSTTPNGMAFTIIDENRQPIAAATMMVGSREFVADDAGRIVMPPVVDQVSRRAIISDGKIAEQVSFEHLREQYRLTAGMHIDRTQLQTGGTREVLIRPRLMMGNTLIDPKTLKDVSVRIEAKDLDGISTARQIDDLELNQHAELTVPIRVPSRLTHLSVTLSGTIDGLADAQEQTLQTSRSWDIAGIRRTSHVHDAFLTRDGDEYVIEIRGRNGEPVPAAAVNVSLVTELRNAPVEQTLQSDDKGRVRLSKLAGVTQIRFGVPAGLQHTRDLQLDQVHWANEIHTTTDREIRLPLPEPLANVKDRYRLLSLRDRNQHSDRTDQLSIDKGLLIISKLDAGDYELLDRHTAARVQIKVVEGPAIRSIATGQIRHLSISPRQPIGIESIKRDDAGLKIQLSGETKLARVHFYATRYLDETSPLSELDLPLPPVFGRRVSLPRCGYVSDLRLGDEYQYVLRRRYAKKYPGVMLPQPSVLLNPWETEETVNETQSARGGMAVPPSAAAAFDGADAAAMMKQQAQAQAVSSEYDFLADPGAFVANLRPDENGLVVIANDVIEGMPLLQIVVSDPISLLQRVVTAPLTDIETTDLRLAKALDAKTPLTLERAVSVASPDQPLDLASLGSAQLQVYATVGGLLELYQTLVNDSRLRDFAELGDWHSLQRGDKIDAYSRLASHELHLFLWSHDRPFFDEVVKPYLQNKKEKQFVDDWLLERELTHYTSLWRYNQLNIAERALLAMRLPEARETVQRELRERVAQRDENYIELGKNIESALKRDGLQENNRTSDRFRRQLGALNDVSDERMSRKAAAVRSDLRAVDKDSDSLEKEPETLFGMIDGRGLALGGMGGGAFFRELDSTKQWAESQWDRVRTVGGPQGENLIAFTPFWTDLANNDHDKIQVSSNLLQPVTNRHDALAAIAMCGLPLVAGEVNLPAEDDQLYRPAHAVAVVTKRLKTLQAADEESSILIGQRFESLDEAQRKENKSAAEPNEFLTGVAYRGQTVVSNPTAEKRVVDVFWQIPAGSLPLAGNRLSDSRTIVLEPFAVQSIEYQFYFPAAGDFVHYPATVAEGDQLLSRGTEKTFRVVAEPTEQDAITWDKIARSGTPAQIAAFLAEANLRELDWMLIAHRMQDQDVYHVVIRELAKANLPISQLWAYSLKHRDEPAMRSYLSMQDNLVDRVGPVLHSPLLDVDPIERRMHELLEYAPLVRARIHRLGEENEILNPTFLEQYRSFVRMLGYAGETDPHEQLVLTYYLLLQNRIEEAIETFTTIERGDVQTQLQYDYVDAYLAMHREQFDLAEKIARKYADHPVPRWQSRFVQLAAQLNQRRSLLQSEQLVSVDKTEGEQPIAEGTGDLSVMDRERRQENAADLQPEVVVRVEGDSLRIDHRRTKQATVNLYGVDLELLFSKAPFVREDLQRMAMVRPMRSDAIDFDQPTGVGRFELDDDLKRQTLLVEVVAGASRSTALYYGGEIMTYVSESYGQLQTTDAKSHRPISTAYVKVYGKYPDGSVRFYKDGYTDARGRFDYASISASDARGANRFAILVVSEEKGATLHDVASPNQ